MCRFLPTVRCHMDRHSNDDVPTPLSLDSNQSTLVGTKLLLQMSAAQRPSVLSQPLPEWPLTSHHIFDRWRRRSWLAWLTQLACRSRGMAPPPEW
jgi:hypothetical protein